jgi:hypothetical protein
MVTTAGYIGTPTTTAGDYFQVDNGYYGGEQPLGYGVQGGVGHDFYTASSVTGQADWLAASSDPFVSAGQGADYFYVCDDSNTMPRTTRS